MDTKEECVCCTEVQHTNSLLDSSNAGCITDLEDFQVHLHPAILQTMFNTQRKNWGKDNKPKGRDGQLSNRLVAAPTRNIMQRM